MFYSSCSYAISTKISWTSSNTVYLSYYTSRHETLKQRRINVRWYGTVFTFCVCWNRSQNQLIIWKSSPKVKMISESFFFFFFQIQVHTDTLNSVNLTMWRANSWHGGLQSIFTLGCHLKDIVSFDTMMRHFMASWWIQNFLTVGCQILPQNFTAVGTCTCSNL